MPSSKPGSSKKISIVKSARPRAKPGPQGTSEIELVLAKPIGVSKKFHLLDVIAPSYGLDVGGFATTHVEHDARVQTFDNVDDDSSLDIRETPLPKRTREKCAFLPPPASSEFLCFSFVLLQQALMTVL
jgi:hypothetical protein